MTQRFPIRSAYRTESYSKVAFNTLGSIATARAQTPSSRAHESKTDLSYPPAHRRALASELFRASIAPKGTS